MSRPGAVSPAVAALRTAIESTESALAKDGHDPPSNGDGLLFLGVWSDALPRFLIEDPVLAPTDKVVWQIIRLHARSRGATAFPDYETIGRLANVRAPATIARAIAMLRISRWLTLCARVRDPQGRFRGNVYVLHDEPLALGDTLHLDPEYMPFLESATGHRHGRVRLVALAARATIEDEIRSGCDVTQSPHAIERRVEAARTVHAHSQGGFYSFNRRRLGEIQHTEAHAAAGSVPTSKTEDGTPNDPGACSPTDKSRTQKFFEDGQNNSSSRSIKTTTTTQKPAHDQKKIAPDLVLPERLSTNHQALARLYLERIPPHLQQAVLDELEGRLRAERRGAPPVFDPLRFLKRLCDAALSGEFVPNLGVDVQAERERAQRATQHEHHAATEAAVELSPTDPNNRLVKMALRMQVKQRAGTSKA